MKSSNRGVQVSFVMLTACCATLVLCDTQAAELLERAVLPSATFSPGPTSGQFATGGNGVVTPFINRQPVQGFSAVLRGPVKGTFLVMSDNGFGNKANSPDALLRVYAVKPDFETGAVAPVNRIGQARSLQEFTAQSYITLSDPWRRVPFPIVADGAVYPGTPVGGGSIAVDPSIRAETLADRLRTSISSRSVARPTARCGSAMSSVLISFTRTRAAACSRLRSRCRTSAASRARSAAPR